MKYISKPSFSIVIPYHGHVSTIDFIKKQLNYYHAHSIPMPVIVALSGDEIIQTEFVQFVEGLQDSRFEVLHSHETNITNWESYLRKIYDALKRVKTPYVILNGADDVIIPSAVHKGIEIFDRNSDVAAVWGTNIYFTYETGDTFCYKQNEYLGNTTTDRVEQYMKSFMPIFYSIRRTDDLQREYRNFIDLSNRYDKFIKNALLMEFFQDLSIVSMGKVYYMDTPWRIVGSRGNAQPPYSMGCFNRYSVIDRDNFEWLKSVSKNMEGLSYNHYKYLWIWRNIRNMHVSFVMVAYNFIKKQCTLRAAIMISLYHIANKIYRLYTKFYPRESFLFVNCKPFFKTDEYKKLEKHYFSEKDLKLLTSKKFN